jgi:hypothetical protein
MTYRKVTTLQLRVVETIEVTDDDNSRPSFRAPAADVVQTDGETVSETTLPLRPLAKCPAIQRTRKLG